MSSIQNLIKASAAKSFDPEAEIDCTAEEAVDELFGEISASLTAEQLVELSKLNRSEIAASLSPITDSGGKHLAWTLNSIS